MLSLWFWAHVQWLEKTVLAECFCERAKELWHSPTHSSRQRNLQILCPKFPKQEKYKCNSLLQSVYLRISIAIFQNPFPPIQKAPPALNKKACFCKTLCCRKKKPCQKWDIFAFKTKNRKGNIWWRTCDILGHFQRFCISVYWSIKEALSSSLLLCTAVRKNPAIS